MWQAPSQETLVTRAVSVVFTARPGPDSTQGTPCLTTFAVPATTGIQVSMLGSEVILIIPRQAVFVSVYNIRHVSFPSFSPLRATRSVETSLPR